MATTTTSDFPHEFKDALATVFEQLQDQRAVSVETVRDAQLAARPLFQLEAERLAAKLGPDDPRVTAMLARADNRLDVATALTAEIEIANIRVPKVERNDTLIQGRLTDAKLQAIPGVQVQLVDDKGKDLGVPAVQTDASGYYAFTMNPEMATKIGEGTRVTIAVGEDRASFVPETAPAILFTPGARTTAEVALKGADYQKIIGKINLSSVPRSRPVSGGAPATPPPKSAGPTASGTPRKGKK